MIRDQFFDLLRLLLLLYTDVSAVLRGLALHVEGLLLAVVTFCCIRVFVLYSYVTTGASGACYNC